MIKLNLIGTKKNSGQVVIFGLNFASVNWPLVLTSFVLLQLLPFVMGTIMKPKLNDIKGEIAVTQRKIKSVNKILKKNKKIKILIEQNEKKKKKFITIKKTIESIISTKINPFPVLYFLARNFPKGVWLENLKMGTDKLIEIKGRAIASVNVSELMKVINSSYYFKSETELVDSDNQKKKKYITYLIKAKIDRYNE